ncbi:MAG: M1 family aminopeptidase [Candidatus Omnitrophota bacterium]
MVSFAPRALSATVDHPQYDIHATVDITRHSINATQAVTFTNGSEHPVSSVYFHIYPHRRYTKNEMRIMNRYAGYFKVNPYPEGFQSGDLDIKSVRSFGAPLSYTIEGDDRTILNVALPRPLLPGQTINIDLEFSVQVPHSYGRFGWHKNIISLTRWYPVLSVLDNAGWHNYPFYIYHQPFFSDAAYYRLSLTVPQDQQVVSGCVPGKSTINPDGTKTVLFEKDLPMRDLGVGISPDFKAVELKQGDYKILSYYVHGNLSAAKAAAGHAAALMRFYEARFGPYPYKEFSIVPSYLGFGGDQSSGLIFIDTRLYRLPAILSRYFNFLVSHETGHQWFYNIVGSDEYKEMFLDEGMNSYWILRYLENTYGRDAKVMALPKGLAWLIPNFSFRDSTIARYMYLAKGGYDRPVVGELSSFREPSSIFALAYGKGAAFLMMLESYLGRDTFDRIVERYAREFAFRNFSLEALCKIANEESGMNLDDFFEQWLKTDKNCDFAVRAVQAHSVTIENRGALQMPVETVVTYTDGTTQSEVWDGSGRSHAIAADDRKKIARVDVDPENAIVLDLDRINNHWPRQKTLRFAPLYFFAYEMPFFYPRDSYNGAAGPTVGGSSLGIASSVQKPFENLLRLRSVYDFNGKAFDSMLGYQVSNFAGKQNSLGFEVFDYESSKETHDVSGGKVYWRRELWPANYGLFDTNDHATLYFIRDQRLDSTDGLSGREDIRNLHYRKKNEAIFGVTGSLGRYGPYGDPSYGWRVIPTQEFAGHVLGGDQSFWRSSVELQNYFLVWQQQQHKIATRIRAGWGEHSDKDLFELGGADALRGYSRKDVQGSHSMLAGVEYRLPLRNDMRIYLLDNIFCLNAVQAVGFFDVGKSWYSSFGGRSFKKDAGVGLRLHFGVCGGLERIVVRFDAAHAINDPKQDTHFWLGINQAF